LCNFLTKLIATGDDKKGLYLHVIVRKIPCAPAPCLQLLETTFRFIADEILLAVDVTFGSGTPLTFVITS
jgi:hypothetical protein